MIPEITQSYGMALDYLRRLVDEVPDARMTEQPGPVVNHPAWVIGHLVHSCQAIGGEMGLGPWLARDWASRYGTGSLPTADRAKYPTKNELLEAPADGQRRIFGRIDGIGEAGLAAALPDVRYRETFPTIGHAVLHILMVHTALHVGQITVWRLAVGLGPLSENLL